VFDECERRCSQVEVAWKHHCRGSTPRAGMSVPWCGSVCGAALLRWNSDMTHPMDQGMVRCLSGCGREVSVVYAVRPDTLKRTRAEHVRSAAKCLFLSMLWARLVKIVGMRLVFVFVRAAPPA
jgi:hypothetical protein